ncbi:MAG: hypothetical protein CMJ78_17970 [Planctomycetaceae bacterium]|nr:hypothetical protein [Planctomycetaceae bacterium]
MLGDRIVAVRGAQWKRFEASCINRNKCSEITEPAAFGENPGRMTIRITKLARHQPKGATVNSSCLRLFIVAALLAVLNTNVPAEDVLWRRARRGGVTGHLVSGKQSLAVSPDGRLLAVWFMASKKDEAAYQLRIWDLSTLKVIFKSPWKVRSDSVVPRASLAFSPDGNVLAVEDFPRLVRLFRVNRADRVQRKRKRRNSQPELSLTPLAVLDQDVASEPITRYVHTTQRKSMTMSFDRRTGASYSADKSRNAPATAHCGHLCFSPDGTKLAVASTLINGSSIPAEYTERVIKIWSIASTETSINPTSTTAILQHTIDVPGYPFDPMMSFSTNGDKLTSCHNAAADPGQLGTINIWDSKTGKRISQFHPTAEQAQMFRPNEAAPIAFSSNGKMTAWYEGAPTVSLWSSETGKRKTILTGHSNLPRTGTFSPDGKLFVTPAKLRSKNRRESAMEIVVWDTDTGELKSKTKFDDSGSGWVLAFTPQSQSVVIGGYSTLVLRTFDEIYNVRDKSTK